MHSKLGAGAGLCLFLAAIVANAAVTKQTLSIGDMSADLKTIQGTPLDVVSKQNIQYAVTGDPAYDEFFKKAAVAYGGLAVGNRMSEAVAVDLVSIAKSWAASKEASDELKKLLAGKDLQSLTPDLIKTILRDKRAKLGRLEQTEIESLGRAAHHLAIATLCLKSSIEAAGTLLPLGQQLTAGAAKQFALWDYPKIAKEILESIKRLSRVKDDGLSLTKNLAVFSELVAALIAGS